MKIGILTLPPTVNYGGILQTFSLQRVLINKGYDAVLIDKRFKISRFKYFKQNIRYILFKIINKDTSNIIRSRKELEQLSIKTKQFIDKYIIKTDPILEDDGLHLYNNFDAYIVGSDQVWRPIYVDNIYNYYFNFISNRNKVIRIAYAASFGTDKWEYTDKQTKRCGALIKKFSAISVREISGVELCRSKYSVIAEHVLDPTLLLTKEDYLNFIDLDKFNITNNALFSYVLDSSIGKTDLINKISTTLDFSIYNLALNNRDTSGNIVATPPVEYFVNGINKSEFVITDSFHGTVFAIIFNKPFITIINKKRGSSRFESLFRMLNIDGNIIYDMNDVDLAKLIHRAKTINWNTINHRLSILRLESINFLENSLNNN